MSLTHRHIEVFRAVMQCGQVTRAADWLHTSQPTLSRELARMEQVVGYPLFDRIRGRLHPTPRALALMDVVQSSYTGLERVVERARELAQDPMGHLQVACLPALAQSLLPEAVASWLSQRPEARLSVVPLDSPALEAALGAQRFDLGLGEVMAPQGCGGEVVFTANEVCVLPQGHPLAQKRVLQPPDLAGARFVSLAAGDPYRIRIDQVFEQWGVRRHLQVESGSAASVCALVAAGAGVAMVNPLTALSLQAGAKGLVLRPLSVDIAFQVVLSWPLGRPAHPLREHLFTALRHQCATLEAALAAATVGS
ncbi:MAG: LysR family transcriptional regulator [Burkholderiaceae bacterium]